MEPPEGQAERAASDASAGDRDRSGNRAQRDCSAEPGREAGRPKASKSDSRDERSAGLSRSVPACPTGEARTAMGTRMYKPSLQDFGIGKDRPRPSCAEASRYAAACGRDVNGMDQVQPLHKGVRRRIRITFNFLAADANVPRHGQNTPDRGDRDISDGRRRWTGRNSLIRDGR